MNAFTWVLIIMGAANLVPLIVIVGVALFGRKPKPPRNPRRSYVPMFRQALEMALGVRRPPDPL